MLNKAQYDRFSPLSDEEVAAASPPNGSGQRNNDDGELISPVPADAPDLPMAHHIYGRPTGRWAYRDATGAVMFCVLRFDPPGERKQFLPLTMWRKDGRSRWRWKAVPEPRPLYNLDKLTQRPLADIVVCEGEKAADAAAKIYPNSVTTSSPNGSESAKKADWSPLKGRQALIWPDADTPGDQYVADVSQILEHIGCEFSVIDARKLAALSPDGGKREAQGGWDAANALTEWSDLESLRRAAIACSKPHEPKPAFVSFDEFTMSARGLTAEVKEGKSDNAITKEIRVSSAFEVLGASRDPTGHGWGKWISWQDADGRVHTRHVPDSALQGEVPTLCGALADAGLRINRTQQKLFVNYLSFVPAEARVTHVDRTGWHEINGRQVFVLPDETIGVERTHRVVLDTTAIGAYERCGSLQDWRAGVGTLAHSHALPVLAISAALAGPLLYLAGQEGGGINIFGQSSKGKTTVLQAAGSVWGRGATPGYVRSWRSTANGLEGVAAATTDTALILDELGVMEAREAGASLYSLSNGAGKERARRDGSLRNARSWRVLYISSGEVPIETKLAEDRSRKARAGQLVRMLDIPADRGLSFGAFDHTGSAVDAAALSKAFKLSARTAYGTAGPEFIRRIVTEGTEGVGATLRDMIVDFTTRFVPQHADGQIIRAAERLGLIAAAGELATALGITPWAAAEATDAAAWALGQWIRMRGGTEAAEVRQAVDQVRFFIEQHGEARFEDADDSEGRVVVNRAGWRKGSGPEREWWIPPQVWKSEICAGLDATLVAKTLAERGMLRRAKDGYQPVVKVAAKSVRVYILLADIIEGGHDEG
jgi:putative DNA primase/helicase